MNFPIRYLKSFKRNAQNTSLGNTISKLELIKFSNHVTNRRTVAKKCKYLTTFPYGSNAYP